MLVIAVRRNGPNTKLYVMTGLERKSELANCSRSGRRTIEMLPDPSNGYPNHNTVIGVHKLTSHPSLNDCDTRYRQDRE